MNVLNTSQCHMVIKEKMKFPKKKIFRRKKFKILCKTKNESKQK